jgi:cytidyltransferase-related domain
MTETKSAGTFVKSSERCLSREELRSRLPTVFVAADRIASALRTGHRLFIFGNGGSAGDAQHIAAELVGRFVRERRALPALALTTDSSIVTAIANDYGFDKIFTRQLDAFAKAGDVALGISTSGNSKNVVNATRLAKQLGLTTVALTGGDGGVLSKEAEISITIGASTTAEIQEFHIMVGHLLCELIEENLFTHHSSNSLGRIFNPITERKILSLETLVSRRAIWRDQQKTVVWTNGCFDVIHAGHIRSLEAAKQLGDILLVGVNSDASVRRIKGPSRPVVHQKDRTTLIAALECVDAVALFEEDTPEAILQKVQPDLHCKGADYAPPSGKPIPEAKIVEAYGGRVAFLPLVPGLSTTKLLEKLG